MLKSSPNLVLLCPGWSWETGQELPGGKWGLGGAWGPRLLGWHLGDSPSVEWLWCVARNLEWGVPLGGLWKGVPSWLLGGLMGNGPRLQMAGGVYSTLAQSPKKQRLGLPGWELPAPGGGCGFTFCNGGLSPWAWSVGCSVCLAPCAQGEGRRKQESRLGLAPLLPTLKGSISNSSWFGSNNLFLTNSMRNSCWSQWLLQP